MAVGSMGQLCYIVEMYFDGYMPHELRQVHSARSRHNGEAVGWSCTLWEGARRAAELGQLLEAVCNGEEGGLGVAAADNG